MASLNFDTLKKAEITNNNYLYTDLHLDIDNPVVRDLTTDNNEDAIRNSINNLFNTVPGQNLLNPTYGLNLMRFLFTPASTTTARQIGDTIIRNISIWEPRVIVNNVNVDVNIDEQTYTVTLSISIPQFNRTIKIPGVLSKTSFTLL